MLAAWSIFNGAFVCVCVLSIICEYVHVFPLQLQALFIAKLGRLVHHTNYGTRVGVLHQIFVRQVQHAKENWTQSDLRFCENEGSKRSKINDKGDQLD